ncbi:uncharacterized protein (DUF2141 family) [Sphingopyxis panaciterrae]|uniref:DUF2141 domain-containing protein n=1 Tax=Sphingopyxis panaciterrae TaxID=363841 RepID=UPI001FBAB016|nr:DUF2141 domain-containing protein [Sphingopyxis panaciterrae]NIJ37518.1 uncharacterized protein (DUF2141 family) [Sphingopyxis panaciterrae]
MALLLIAAAPVKPDPSLGKAEAACRQNEPGPALIVAVAGLKDRKGMVRAELYPVNDSDFLADDAVLINAKKLFRRVDLDLPPSGPVTLCLRVPGPGRYSLSVLHDRNHNLKWDKLSEGLGFGGNPKLGWSKPKAFAASVVVGTGPARTEVVMNYLSGLKYRPLERK